MKQVGNDRIIVLEFSNGLYYLVLEFFSAGNVILLNTDKEILSLQRLVQEKENNSKYAVREKYQMFDPAVLFADSVKYYHDEEEGEDNDAPKEEVNEKSTDEKRLPSLQYDTKTYTLEDLKKWLAEAKEKEERKSVAPAAAESKFHQSKKKKEPKALSILKLLFLNASYLSSDLLQTNLIEKDIDPTQSSKNLESDEELQLKVVEVLNKSENQVSGLLNVKDGIEGYIVLKRNPLYDPNEEKIQSSLLGNTEELSTEYTFDSFHPFRPNISVDALENNEIKLLVIKGYNKTLDKFFSSIDLLKNALKIQQSKTLLDKKLNSVKQENLAKIGKLTNLETTNYRKAELIILNADKIEQCKSAVQILVDQGMDWNNIETLINAEAQRGNKIAGMIALPLNLKSNKIKVRILDQDTVEDNEDSTSDSDSDSLSDISLDSDAEEELEETTMKPAKDKKNATKKNAPQNFVVVDIDLSMSAYANSKTYFDQKKNAQLKKEKTEKTAELALKSSERKINTTLKKDIERSNKDLSIRKLRQKNWFEKFYWFLSSEGYLVIAPKDNLQLEMIYYKYFNSTNDYYVTSDVEGSLHVFVKNPFKGQEIPPSTLNQAGMFSLSASKAWNSKILTSAWYVEGDKLTKKDNNDGSLLPDGMVNIKGEKNYLPPSQLSMGIGLLWVLDEQSAKNRKEKRLTKQDQLGFELIEEIADIKDVAKEKISKLNSKLQNLSLDEANLDIKDEKNDEPDAVEANLLSPTNSESENKSVEMPEREPEPEPEPVSVKGGKSVSSKMANSSGSKRANVRGKRGKQKKMSQKYADQDEEERLMRLKALGVLKQIEENEKENAEKQAALAAAQDENNKFKGKGSGGNSHSNAIKQQKKYNEQFMDILEEDLTDANYLEIFDSLAEKIVSLNEKFIDVMPMFGPWQSFAKFKYKAKIQPGSNKVGKSMNEVLHYFVNRKSNKETSLVKKHEEKKLSPGPDSSSSSSTAAPDVNSASLSQKSLDSYFDFDLDFDAEHNVINQLKPLDLQPAFTVKGIRIVLPSNAGGASGGGGKNRGGDGGKGNNGKRGKGGKGGKKK